MNRHSTIPFIEEMQNSGSSQWFTMRQLKKKQPPPRPPSPDFSKIKSKSEWNLHSHLCNSPLSDLRLMQSSTPFSASSCRFGGSVSSSFGSSTSSLASSKRSFEYECVNSDHRTVNSTNRPGVTSQSLFYVNNGETGLSAPTIIRPQVNKKYQSKPKTDSLPRSTSPPMPLVPPPSPPKQIEEVTTPYGIALFDYTASQKSDLTFKANDVIFLIRRINSEWLYGRIEDQEGMFPSNYISIQVPLPEDDRLVTALYDFIPEVVGDLPLKPGQLVLVTGRVSSNWLIGESNGCIGQFPVNFVDRIPSNI